MSKYVDSLLKGNQTLSAQALELQNQIQELLKEKGELLHSNYELKMENARLKGKVCNRKDTCKMLESQFLNVLDAFNSLGR